MEVDLEKVQNDLENTTVFSLKARVCICYLFRNNALVWVTSGNSEQRSSTRRMNERTLMIHLYQDRKHETLFKKCLVHLNCAPTNM